MSQNDVIVKLALENKQLSKQLADTERKFKKSMGNMGSEAERMGNKVGTAMRNLAKGGGVLGAAVAGVAALGQAIQASVKHVDDLKTAADQLGISFKSFQELQYIAVQSDVAVEKLTTSFAKMQDQIGSLGTGNGAKFAETLQKIGINATLLQQAAPERQFEIIAEALSKVESPARRAALGVDIFGKGFKDLNPLIAQGEKGIKSLREEINKNGGIISDETMVKMTRFDNQMNELNIRTKALQAEALAPLVGFLNGEFSKAIDGQVLKLDSFRISILGLGPAANLAAPGLQHLFNIMSGKAGSSPPAKLIDTIISPEEFNKRQELLRRSMDRAWLGMKFVPTPAESAKQAKASGGAAGKAFKDGVAEALQAEADRVNAFSKLLDLEAEGDAVKEAVRAYAKGIEELVQIAKDAMLSMDDPRILAQIQKLQDELSKVQQTAADAWIEEMIARADEASGKLKDVADRFREDEARKMEIIGFHINALFGAMARGSDAVKDVVKGMIAELISAIAYAAILQKMGGGSGSFGATLGDILTGSIGMGGKAATAPTIRVMNFGGGVVNAKQRSNGDLDVIINAVAGRIASGGSPLDKALNVGYGLARRGT